MYVRMCVLSPSGSHKAFFHNNLRLIAHKDCSLHPQTSSKETQPSDCVCAASVRGKWRTGNTETRLSVRREREEEEKAVCWLQQNPFQLPAYKKMEFPVEYDKPSLQMIEGREMTFYRIINAPQRLRV
jgi:hypothetical protein